MKIRVKSKYGVFIASICVLLSFSLSAEEFTQENDISLLSNNDAIVSVFGDTGNQSFIGKGELWLNNWGVSAQLLQSDESNFFGILENSQYLNLDVKRRFGNTQKSNIELGLGWQEFDIDSQFNVSGPRLSLSGKFNIVSKVKLYGQTSFFPSLDDKLRHTETGSGFELEAGVLYQPFPFISLKAGYRHFSLDLEDPKIEEIGSTGFLLGTDWGW